MAPQRKRYKMKKKITRKQLRKRRKKDKLKKRNKRLKETLDVRNIRREKDRKRHQKTSEQNKLSLKRMKIEKVNILFVYSYLCEYLGIIINNFFKEKDEKRSI